MTSDAHRVIGIGEVVWDDLPSGRRLGGAPGNVAYHCRTRGAEAAVVTAVGDDELGREALAKLEALGLDTSGVAVLDRPTGLVDVTLDGSGSASYVIRQPVAWDFIPATDRVLELAGSADAVVFGSLAQREPASRETIRRVLDVAKDAVKVFDVNIRPPHVDAETVVRSLASADVFKLNDDEIPPVAQMTQLPEGEADFAAAARERFGLRLVAVTRGGEGSALYTADGVHEQPPKQVEVKDTVGAGDSFTSAIVMGLLRGEDLATMHRRAQAVAGYVCTQDGATPDVPDDVLNA